MEPSSEKFNTASRHPGARRQLPLVSRNVFGASKFKTLGGTSLWRLNIRNAKRQIVGIAIKCAVAPLFRKTQWESGGQIELGCILNKYAQRRQRENLRRASRIMIILEQLRLSKLFFAADAVRRESGHIDANMNPTSPQSTYFGKKQRLDLRGYIHRSGPCKDT